MENCDVNANKIKSLEARIEKLEQYREKDKTQLYELDKSLSVFINEMKNISDELKTIVANFKEAIIRSTNAQEKELQVLKEKVTEQDKKIKELDVKVEQETVVANAEKWKKITSYIATAVVGAVVAFILAKIGIS